LKVVGNIYKSAAVAAH